MSRAPSPRIDRVVERMMALAEIRMSLGVAAHELTRKREPSTIWATYGAGGGIRSPGSRAQTTERVLALLFKAEVETVLLLADFLRLKASQLPSAAPTPRPEEA